MKKKLKFVVVAIASGVFGWLSHCVMHTEMSETTFYICVAIQMLCAFTLASCADQI